MGTSHGQRGTIQRLLQNIGQAVQQPGAKAGTGERFGSASPNQRIIGTSFRFPGFDGSLKTIRGRLFIKPTHRIVDGFRDAAIIEGNNWCPAAKRFHGNDAKVFDPWEQQRPAALQVISNGLV